MGIIYTHDVAEGEATHLGHFTMIGDAKIHLPSGIVEETLTITAANGDMLFLTTSGRGTDPTHGLGTFTFVGGTGRFQGATGSFEQTITFAVPPGSSSSDSIPFTDVLEGRLTPPGSNK